MASANITQAIADAANSYGVDPNLALEVAITESSLNQNAVGAAGEIGVFQVRPQTAPGVNLADLATNISIGVGLLAGLLGQFGDPMQAVAAYNCGATCVAKAIQKGGAAWMSYIPVSTQAYVTKIFASLGVNYSAQPGPASIVADVTDNTAASLDTLSAGVTQIQSAAAGIDWGAPATWALVASAGLVAFFLVRDLVADA